MQSTFNLFRFAFYLIWSLISHLLNILINRPEMRKFCHFSLTLWEFKISIKRVINESTSLAIFIASNISNKLWLVILKNLSKLLNTVILFIKILPNYRISTEFYKFFSLNHFHPIHWSIVLINFKSLFSNVNRFLKLNNLCLFSTILMKIFIP